MIYKPLNKVETRTKNVVVKERDYVSIKCDEIKDKKRMSHGINEVQWLMKMS